MWLFFFLLVLGFFSWTTQAQDILCPDGQRIHLPITLTSPALDFDNLNEQPFTFAIVSEVAPLVQTSVDPQPFCVSADPANAFFGMELPEITAPTVPQIALATPLDPANQSITFGTIETGTAPFLVMTSRVSVNPDGEEFALSISRQMRESGVPLHLYAFGVDNVDVGLAVVDERGDTVVQNDVPLACEDAGVEPCAFASLVGANVVSLIGSAQGQATDAALSVDLANWEGDELRFRVTGEMYLLVLSVANGALPVSSAPRATLLSDGAAFALTCDQQLAWTDGIALTLPLNVTVTALGTGGNDPVLALVDENGEGVCDDDNPNAASYAANLPGYSVNAQLNSAQVIITEPTQRLFVGNKGDTGGELFLIVEGLDVGADGQMLSVQTTEGMVAANSSLTVWATSLDGALDPMLAWVTDDNLPKLDFAQLPYTCDNAGVFDTCYGQSERLRGSTLVLAEGRELPFDNPDSTLDLPIFPDTAGQGVRVLLSAANDTTGQAVVVVRVVSQ